jgi:hypothetical protein
MDRAPSQGGSAASPEGSEGRRINGAAHEKRQPEKVVCT